MSYKISVIIPVYNAEDAINQAIDSVINQTIGFEHIELIIVDDNSTDNTQNIVNNYAKKYNNIKFFKLEKNTGLPSKPRNIGIDNVTAPYIMFLDADDMLTKESCQVLYETVKLSNSEIGYCNYCSQFLDGFYSEIDEQSKSYQMVENKSLLRMTIWGYIYDTEFIKRNNIKFQTVIPEDGIFAAESIGKASKIVELPKFIGYIYTVESMHNDSFTHYISKEKFEEYITGHYKYVNYVRKFNLDEKILLTASTSILILMFFKIKASKKEKIELLKKLRDFENSLNFNVQLSNLLNPVNQLILDEHYNRTILISSITSLLYKNNKIKNLIFKRYSSIKKIEL